MLAAVTPRSAARALSGRTMISGRTSEALELILPMPLRSRSSRSTNWAACIKACGSSLLSTSCSLPPVSGEPTLKRAPAISAMRARIWASMSCMLSLRSLRCTALMVSTARRASAAAPGANASPLEPPPIELKMLTICGMSAISLRACSAMRSVCAKVLPGASSIVTCVCPRSPGGIKVVGSKPTKDTEPTKNRPAPIAVTSRWRKHHRITRK